MVPGSTRSSKEPLNGGLSQPGATSCGAPLPLPDPVAELLHLPVAQCPRGSPRGGGAQSRARCSPSRCGRSTRGSPALTSSGGDREWGCPARTVRSSATRVTRCDRPGSFIGSMSGTPGTSPQVSEEALEREVLAAADVALAPPFATLVGEQVAFGRQSRTSTMLRASVDVGRDAAQEEPPHRDIVDRALVVVRLPRTNDGLTITTGTPCAASRSASTSASCFEVRRR